MSFGELDRLTLDTSHTESLIFNNRTPNNAVLFLSISANFQPIKSKQNHNKFDYLLNQKQSSRLPSKLQSVYPNQK